MDFKPGRRYNNMYEYTLSNGLTLLLVPRHGIDVVTCNVTYHVGSRNEGLGLTGATHYLEHGLFKGSNKYNKEKGNGMSYLEQLGATMNATTYMDRTNYFEVIETDKLCEAVKREADRMQSPLLTAELLNSEMSVVRNEFERGENSDFQVLHKGILAAAFESHSYHHSTIGYKSDIENISAKALRDFHDTYYLPNNATYTFVGNFDPVKVKDMVAEAFSSVAAGPDPPKMYTKEQVQTGQRRLLVQRPSNTSMLGIAFKSVAGLHRDAITLEVIANLMRSPNSPIESLKHKGIVHDVIPSWERMRDPYVFNVYVTTNGASEQILDNAEKAIMDYLQSYRRPSVEDLQAAKRTIRFDWESAMETTQGMAMEINEAISRGDSFDVFHRFDILNDVSVDDITRVARQTFVTDQSTVGWFLPGNAQEERNFSEHYPVGAYPNAPTIDNISAPMTNNVNFVDTSTSSLCSRFTKYDSSKSHARISIQSNKSCFSVQEMAVRLILSKMMTKGVNIKDAVLTEQKIHAFLNENGIERAVGPGAYGMNVIVSTPSKSPQVTKRMVNLLRNELKTPSLDEKSFKYLKVKVASEIRGASNDVNKLAHVHLSQALFQDGCNRAHSSNDLASAIGRLSYSDVKREHMRLIDHGVVRMSVLSPSDEVLNLFKTLCGESDEVLAPTFTLNTSSPSAIDVKIPAKSSCTVKWGHVIDKPTHATNLAIRVLGHGFQGRLMSIVRDKYGLTYGIGAHQVDLYGASVFEISATFSPAMLKRGIMETEKVLADWKENIADGEIERQRQAWIGSQVVSWDDPNAISGAIHANLIAGKSLGEIDDFKSQVSAVTYDEVRTALSEQLHIEKLKRVTVGTF